MITGASDIQMYMINLMIIYDVANIFSMKNYKSSRKLGVGLNWYPGVNWSTTTSSGGGPIHARVAIHAHPQFSQRFVLLHGKNVYHIIDNYQIDHIH